MITFEFKTNTMSQSKTVDEFVFFPHCNDRFKRRGLTRHIRCAHLNSENTLVEYEDNGNSNNQNLPNHINTLFCSAFGKPLLNSDGVVRDETWHTRWKNTMKLYGKQFMLPNGAV